MRIAIISFPVDVRSQLLHWSRQSRESKHDGDDIGLLGYSLESVYLQMKWSRVDRCGASANGNGDNRRGYPSHRPILHFPVGGRETMRRSPTSRDMVLRL